MLVFSQGHLTIVHTSGNNLTIRKAESSHQTKPLEAALSALPHTLPTW